MKVRYLAGIIAVALAFALGACSQTRKISVASGKDHAKLLEATMQRTFPGRQEQEPYTDYKFWIQWKGNTRPETFFWKGQDSWMTCSIERIRKKRENYAADSGPYHIEEITPERIKKGDTLQIRTISGGKFPIPAAIPANMKEVLLFKTNKSKWMYLAVRDFIRLPDIILH